MPLQFLAKYFASGTGQHVPRFSKDKTVTSGSKLDAVEVPDSGSSYNPSLQDHQELLWKGRNNYPITVIC